MTSRRSFLRTGAADGGDTHRMGEIKRSLNSAKMYHFHSRDIE